MLSLTVSSVEGNFIYLEFMWKLCYIAVKQKLLVGVFNDTLNISILIYVKCDMYLYVLILQGMTD
jgi:hypothetical protein